MGKVKRARQKAHISAVKAKKDEPNDQNAGVVEMDSDQVCSVQHHENIPI